MGRGLSPLQQTILRLAYQNRVAEYGSTEKPLPPNVVYAQILAEYYGWVSQHGDVRRHHSGNHYNRVDIDPRQYNAACAAVARAALRLEQRGLWTGSHDVSGSWEEILPYIVQ